MERKLGRVKIGKVGGEGKRSVGGCSLGIRYTVYLVGTPCTWRPTLLLIYMAV